MRSRTKKTLCKSPVCLQVTWKKSFECREQHLKIAMEIGDRTGGGGASENLGIDFDFLSDWATYYKERQLNVASENVGVAEGRAYGNLGSAYLILCDYPKAIGHREKVFKIATEIGEWTRTDAIGLSLCRFDWPDRSPIALQCLQKHWGVYRMCKIMADRLHQTSTHTTRLFECLPDWPGVRSSDSQKQAHKTLVFLVVLRSSLRWPNTVFKCLCLIHNNL